MDYQRLRVDVRNKLESLVLATNKHIRPIIDTAHALCVDLNHLRTVYRTERLAHQLLKRSLFAMKSSPMKVFCRIRTDERVRILGKSPISVVGDTEVALNTSSGTKTYRFDKVLGPSVRQEDIYAEIGNISN